MHDQTMLRLIITKLEEISYSHRELLRRFTAVEYKVEQLTKGAQGMSKEMDDLQAQVAAQVTVEQSAIALLQGLHDQIVEAGTNATKLGTITSSLKSSADALAAANTVAAAPAPTPAPAPVAAPSTPAPAPAPAAASPSTPSTSSAPASAPAAAPAPVAPSAAPTTPGSST